MTPKLTDVTGAKTLGDCPRIPESILSANQREFTDLELVVDGELPQDLYGHVFIVAPVGTVESGGLPLGDGGSLLNGDGMVYRLDCDRADTVRLTSRIVKPPCYYGDRATQTEPYAKYRFRNHGISRFSWTLGFRNQLNTGFLPMQFGEDNYRLLVTYDAGRPYEIDPSTLEIITPVGANREWRSETSLNFPFAPVLSTAHPAFDAYTKEMFSVNYGRSLGNFLETVPLIHQLDNLPIEIDQVLKNVAELLETSDFVLSLFDLFPRYFQDLVRAFSSAVEKVTQVEIQNFVYLVRWDGFGNLERWRLVLPDGSPVKIEQTIHQIGVTKDYVVLMDTGFTTGLEQVINNPFPHNQGAERILRTLLSRPALPVSTIYIVRREELTDFASPGQERNVVAKKVKIPLEAAHFLVDYKNPQGQITLHISHIAAWDVSEWIRTYDRSAYPPHSPVESSLLGLQQSVVDIGRMGCYTIDAHKAQTIKSQIVYDTNCTWGAGLYAYRDLLSTGMPPGRLDNIYWISFGLWQELLTTFITDLYKNYRYRVVTMPELLSLAEDGVPATLFRMHRSNNSLAIADSYQFSHGYIVSSPQFVPRRGSSNDSTDGYIVCTVFHRQSNEFWLFDARHLAQGPLCKLRHPHLNFGLTLHTAWLPKLKRHPTSYQIPVRQDYEDIIKDPQIQTLFENEIYPYF